MGHQESGAAVAGKDPTWVKVTRPYKTTVEWPLTPKPYDGLIQGSSPSKTFTDCIQGFNNLDIATDGIISAELSDVRNKFIALLDALTEVSGKKGHLQVVQLGTKSLISRLEQERVELVATRSDAVFQAEAERLSRIKVQSIKNQEELEAQDLAVNALREDLAKKVLLSLEKLWKSSPTESNKLQTLRQRLQENHDTIRAIKVAEAALSTELTDEKGKTRDLTSRLAAVESGIDEQEKALREKHRDLEKGYYENVQKLVESRLNDEKAKLSSRLTYAEDKASRYDKIYAAKEETEGRVAELLQGKVLLQQSRIELEQRYRESEEEGKAFKDGYDQLHSDNQTVQAEKSELQSDYDELKRAYDQVLKERASTLGSQKPDQPPIVCPQPLSTATSYDRQAAELQHLNGLVAVWQNTLDFATTDWQESQAKKRELQQKVKEAEQRLKELKPAPKPKSRRANDGKRTPGSGDDGRSTVESNRSATPEDALQPIVHTRHSSHRRQESSDAFPPLSSPAATLATPSNAYQSLRLVGMPKTSPPGDENRSNQT
ncbi:hypothetical protein DDE82_005079 [Stemphylium lycopersici]|nr:hypothetical protein DDE82_005079 [Stemphylium lycopersici]